MIECDADINTKVGKNTPLIVACFKGHIEICKYLIEKFEADVNIKTSSYTALITACFRGDIELFKYLIEHGADIN